MSSTLPTQVLSQSAYHILSDSGEDIPIHGGWQTLRCIALSESSSSSSEASVEIPTFLESKEAMEFLGFTTEAAKGIYERFEKASQHIEGESILDYAKGRIRSVPDVGCLEDDWNGAILAMGITETLCKQILDPEFTDLRLTQNARYWVIDTIEAKFSFLTSLNMNVLGSRPSDHGPVSLQARLQQSKESSSSRSKMLSQEEAGEDVKPQLQTSTTTQAISDTELLLFKGGDCVRLKRAIRLRKETQDVNRIQNVLNEPPGDFAGLARGLYLTKQKQTAYLYASYAKTRLETAGEDPIAVGILHVILPRELTTASVEIHGEMWQEFVWSQRLQLPTADHLLWIDEAPLIIGPVVKSSTDQLDKLADNGMDHKVLRPLRLQGGESASQHFFKGEHFWPKINEQGRFELEILRFLSQK